MLCTPTPRPWLSYALTLSERNLPRYNRIVREDGSPRCEVLPLPERMFQELLEQRSLGVVNDNRHFIIKIKGPRNRLLFSVWEDRRKRADWARLTDEKVLTWLSNFRPTLRLVQ